MEKKDINILVACEESQRVTEAFRKRGFTAYSCDILGESGGHPEWHIQEDVLPLLNGNCEFSTVDGTRHIIKRKWDMIIAFPPCTHLAVSGARHFEKKREDGRQKEGIEFFCQFLKADCDHIVIENPIGIMSGDYVKEYYPELCEKYGIPRDPSQIIQPWMFGNNYAKSTCLWEIGVPKLEPKVTEQPELEWYEFTTKDGKKKRQPKWYFEALKAGKDRSLIRSKTFPGVAEAMGEQWGKFLSDDIINC